VLFSIIEVFVENKNVIVESMEDSISSVVLSVYIGLDVLTSIISVVSSCSVVEIIGIDTVDFFTDDVVLVCLAVVLLIIFVVSLLVVFDAIGLYLQLFGRTTNPNMIPTNSIKQTPAEPLRINIGRLT
jgi:hypothetical protein